MQKSTCADIQSKYLSQIPIIKEDINSQIVDKFKVIIKNVSKY